MIKKNIGFLITFLCILLWPKAISGATKPLNVLGNNPVFCVYNDTTAVVSTKVLKATSDFITPDKYNTDIAFQLFDSEGKEFKNVIIKTSSYDDIPVGLISTINHFILLYHANASTYTDGIHGWGAVLIISKANLEVTSSFSFFHEEPSGIFLMTDSSFIIGTTCIDSMEDKYHLTCQSLNGGIVWSRFYKGSVGVGDFNGGQYSFKPKHFGNCEFYFPIRKYIRDNNPFSSQRFTWITYVYFMDYSGNIIREDSLNNTYVRDICYMGENTHSEIVTKNNKATSIVMYLYNHSKITDSLVLGNSIEGMYNFCSLYLHDTIYTALSVSKNCSVNLWEITTSNKTIKLIKTNDIDSKSLSNCCIFQTVLIKNGNCIKVFYSAIPTIKKSPVEAFSNTFITDY